MVDAAVQTEQLTLEEYIRLYEQEGPFEIIDGERIKLMPPVAKHGRVSKKLVSLFLRLEEKGLGEVYYETPFVLTDSSNWVKGSRVPDVMFFTAERYNAYIEQTPDWGDKPFVLVPDLVVEIVSKNDSYSDLERKVESYIRDGVQLIWVIDPQRRTVTVHQGTTRIGLTEEDTLTGGDVIPDLAIPVGSLFVE